MKRRDTAQSASGDPGRTWRKLGPLRRALECRPGRNLEKIGRTRDEIASQTRVGRRQRNKGRGTHNGAGWRCRGKRRRETGWAHARTRSSSKRAVCTLWSGGSRRESHLTMMIVCRDDRSAPQRAAVALQDATRFDGSGAGGAGVGGAGGGSGRGAGGRVVDARVVGCGVWCGVVRAGAHGAAASGWSVTAAAGCAGSWAAANPDQRPCRSGVDETLQHRFAHAGRHAVVRIHGRLVTGVGGVGAAG